MHPLDQLLQAQPRLWRGRQHPQGQRTEPSGNARLDAFLPGGGWPLGALTELLTPPSGGGEFSLLMPSLKRLRLHFSAATSPEHGGPQLQVVKCRGDNPGSLLLGQRPRPTPHTEHTPAVGRRGMPQHAANDG